MAVDKVVKQETLKIAKGLLVCSGITMFVYLIIGQFNIAVLLGSLYGCAVALLNFFLMGLTVQNVTKTEDEKMAKKKMQFSYSVRQLGLLLLVGLGMYISVQFEVLHWLPILIAIIYPRLIIGVISILNKKGQAKRGDIS